MLTVTISFGNLLCYQLMMCSGNEKKHVFVLAIATCLNIVMNYLLIPVLQHEGAAIASVCTEGAINIIELLYIKRKLELSYKWKPIVHALFCSAIMAVVVIVLNNWIDNMMISLVCCVPVGFLVYVIINLLIKNSLTLEVIAVLKKRIRRG